MNHSTHTGVSVTRQKRVAFYLRVSSEEQAKNGFGLDAQKDSLTKYLKSREADGWTCDFSRHLFIDDGYSGSLESRPAFDRMKKVIERWEIEVVLVNSFDRLFRDVKLCLSFIDTFCIGDVELKSALEWNIDPKHEDGRMFLSFTQIFAENERNKITKRTMAGKRAKASQGHIVSGTTIFWYRKDKDGKAIIHEVEAEVVRRMFDLFVNKRKTQSEIAHILTNEKSPSRSDLDPRAKRKRVNSYGTWSQETISRYIKDSTYMGQGYFGKTTQKKFPWGITRTVMKPREEWILQSFPAIIDEELFLDAQKLLESKANPPRKKHCRKYLLTSMLVCGICGRGYQGYTSGKDTVHYRCRWGKSTQRVEHACPNAQVSWTKIEKFVWGIVSSLLNDPKKFSQEFERISNISDKLSKFTTELEWVEVRLEVERRHIQEAYDMRITAESEQAKSACDNIIKGIEGRIRRLTETKEELSALIKTEREKSATAKNIEGLSTLYKKNLVEIGENFETKERLVKTLIKRVEIHTDVLRVYFQFTNPSSPYETKNNARLISMDYGRKHIS